jgi:hypothetical protein
MPHNPAKQSGTSTRTRWGYLGAFAFAMALAVTGCASTVTPSPVAADTPVAASSDAYQPRRRPHRRSPRSCRPRTPR